MFRDFGRVVGIQELYRYFYNWMLMDNVKFYKLRYCRDIDVI